MSEISMEQGDLFKGTEYERGEDLDPSLIYRERLKKLDLTTSITMQLIDKYGNFTEMEINSDSIFEIRSALAKIRNNWK